MELESSLVIVRREIRDALSDWRITAPMLVLAILFPMLVVQGIALGVPLMDRIDPSATTEKLVPFGAMIVGFFPISYTLVIALESFVGEKERNTLEALLAMPLSDAELFVGKLLAVLISPLVLSLVALAIYVFGLRYALGFHVATGFLLLTVLLSMVEALVMVSGAVVVSSHTTSIRAANLLASFIILPMALVLQGELLLVITGYGQILWFVLISLFVVAVILVRMGVNVFNREEILARESDQISARSIIWKFLCCFRGLPGQAVLTGGAQSKALSLWRLYTVDFPWLLRENWQPIVVSTGVVVVGAILGYVWALQSSLPENVRSIAEIARFPRTLASLDHLSTLGLFLHNLRALCIAAVLSIFTFGSAALLLLLAAVGMAGYYTGQAATMGLDPITFAIAFFVPHGVFEIPVAVIVTAFSLKLGTSLMCPPKGFSFGESLLLAAANWLKVMLVLLPFLLLAAYFEANLTPMLARWLLGGV